KSYLSPYRDAIEQLAQTLTSDTRIPINTMLAEISSNMQAAQRALTTFDLIYVARLSAEAKESLAKLTNDQFLTSDFENAQRIINAVKTQPRSKECWNNLLTVVNRLIGKWIRISEEGLKSYLLDHATIVFSTLIACGRKNMLSMAPIDFLLVDEAAQSVEAATLIPMRFQPSKVLLVGDTKQLPATVISSTLDDSDRSIRRFPSHYQWSMMWRLIEENKQPSLMLTIQYRMHPHICRWPSGQYYEDRLITSPDILPMPLLSQAGLLSRPCAIYQVSGQVESRDGSNSVSNKHEAQYVIKIIEHIRRQNAQCSIGVITPYVAQKQLINEVLASRRNLSSLVDVNTVDGFQGDERDVIIISFTRTHVSAFLKEFRRLNVAITRPKACLIILGAPSLLSNDIGEMIADARSRGMLYSEQDLNRILTTGVVPIINPQDDAIQQFAYAQRMASADSAQALLWARRAAENDHPEAQHYISQIYLSTDAQLGISWLNKAAHQGLALAQFTLGQHFITGTVIVKNVASGILWCERAATTNLIDAIVFLAKCYEEGVEIAFNPTQAQNYYRRAAKLAHTPSFIKLATLLASGTLNNQREAIKWYRKAAEENIVDSYYPLANLLSTVLNNPVEAFTYQIKAAESGHREAQYALALRFKHGDAQCAINIAKAAHFFKLAAIAGHRDAQFIYATCLKEGDGVERNAAEAMLFFQRAADNGHIESCYQYALLKMNQSPQEAYSYFKKAADQDHIEACYQAALLISPISLEQAYPYYKKAALKNHVLAQRECIRYQLKHNFDLESCLAFCEKLVAQGYDSLKFALARLLDTGIAGKTDKAAAYGYYTQLASSNHALACYYYAIMLEEGIVIPQDLIKARQYYSSSPAYYIEAKFRWACLLLEEAAKDLNERKPARVQRAEDLEEIELEGSACMPRRKESTFFSRTNTHVPLTTDQAQAIGLLEFYYNHYDDEKPVLSDTLDHAIERLLFSKPAVTIRTDNTYPAQANYWLGKIFEDGKGVTIDGQRALRHYQFASSVNSEASYRIGYIYESGLGVTKNWALAKRFYQNAADRGHELAAKRLSWSYALWSGPTPNDVALRQASNCVLM
ncbi:MAG: SEL1-like repeat protein, partial [Gammaproteobacteria bacterium]|nr:SEL1-like repeat protein [Gammaproteobacteria bacterium]